MAKITIKKIAEKTGFSWSTVSRVINRNGYVSDDTRKKVEDAIRELDYTPNVFARNLSSGRSNVVGVVIPDIHNPFFGEIIKGIAQVLERENLQIILCDTDENPDKEIKSLIMLKGQMIKGLLITPESDDNELNVTHLNALEEMGIPVVLIDRDVKYSGFDGVFLDSTQGAFQAVDALIKNGHRQIAVIAGPLTSKPGRDRLLGYRKAFETNGLEVDEQFIHHGNFRLESGYEITKEILEKKNRPSAIFASNNMMNLGCIKALKEKKISIGTDIALIGFDEIEILDILSPNVSIVSRPTKKMGTVAAEILLERFKKPAAKQDQLKRITLSPRLILKGSERMVKTS